MALVWFTGVLNGHWTLGGKRHSGAGALSHRVLRRRCTRLQGHMEAALSVCLVTSRKVIQQQVSQLLTVIPSPPPSDA